MNDWDVPLNPMIKWCAWISFSFTYFTCSLIIHVYVCVCIFMAIYKTRQKTFCESCELHTILNRQKYKCEQKVFHSLNTSVLCQWAWFAWRRKEYESINKLNKNIHINKFDVKNIYKLLHSFYGKIVRFIMELTPHKTIQKVLRWIRFEQLYSSVLFLKLDLNFFFQVFLCSYHFYTQNAYHKSWCNLFIAIISMNLKFMPFEKPENEANFCDFTHFMRVLKSPLIPPTLITRTCPFSIESPTDPVS